MDDRLTAPRFPRASAYNPEWIRAGVSGGANTLCLTEWLAGAMDLRPGLRLLDLGCGRALSSVFLRREFGVEVWAADLWFNPSENLQRARAAGCDDGLFPLRADARMLPFAAEFFDAVASIDSFMYYGTDDLFLERLARFVKPGGQIGITGSGLVREINGPIPEHLRAWWTPELRCLHSADWWREHWMRTGIVDVEVADTLDDGWRMWRDWQQAIAPDNSVEIAAVESDQGRYLGYFRVVGRRRPDAHLEEPITAIPTQYTPHPLLRNAPKT